eukprot:6318141-Pyramimonas_sp.AAC.1
MTRRPLSHFFAAGIQSRLRMAPGPGALFFVFTGFSLKSTSASGAPLSTIPPHCSQSTGLEP